MSLRVDLGYSSDKEELMYGRDAVPGLTDFDITSDEEVEVYGLGTNDEAMGTILETPNVKIYQFEHPDEDKFDQMKFELYNHPDSDTEDIQNYLQSNEVNQRDQEIVQYFWDRANPTLEFGV